MALSFSPTIGCASLRAPSTELVWIPQAVRGRRARIHPPERGRRPEQDSREEGLAGGSSGPVVDLPAASHDRTLKRVTWGADTIVEGTEQVPRRESADGA